MSWVDPNLFERRDPLSAYDMSIDEPMSAQHGVLTHSFGFIITSCQKQLKDRTQPELAFAIRYTNELMEQAENIHRSASIEALRNGSDTVFITGTRQVLALFETFDLEDQEHFPDAKPEDFFAVIALAKCFEAIELHEKITAYERGEMELQSNIWGDRIPDEIKLSVYHHQINARDTLVTEARDFVAFVDGIHFTRLHAKKTGKRGAKTRNKDHEALRAHLMKTYAQKGYGRFSNRHAARILYEENQSAVERTLRTDDPAQQIAKWISQHKQSSVPADPQQ